MDSTEKNTLKNIGDSIEGEISFNKEDVLTFARITGDENPLHVDEEFASKSEFGKIIVHGNLAASSFIKVSKTPYPGETILTYKEITFIRPVFVNEPYTLFIKLKSIDYEKNIGEFRSVIKNKEGKTCIVFKSRLKNREVFRKSSE